MATMTPSSRVCVCVHAIVDEGMIASLYFLLPACPSLLWTSLSGCVRRRPTDATPLYKGCVEERRFLFRVQLCMQGVGCACVYAGARVKSARPSPLR